MAHNMGRKRLKAQIEALKESAISKNALCLPLRPNLSIDNTFVFLLWP